MNCNEILARYIEEHGITQAFLCKSTGLEKQKMSNIINCKRKVTADELVSICNALGLSLDYFKA